MRGDRNAGSSLADTMTLSPAEYLCDTILAPDVTKSVAGRTFRAVASLSEQPQSGGLTLDVAPRGLRAGLRVNDRGRE